MGRPKGGTNKNWTKKEKEKIIKEALDNGIRNTARKYMISNGMICNWIKSYKENGDKVIDNKYKCHFNRNGYSSTRKTNKTK